MQLAEKYGPVFSLRRGSQRMVFISGYKMVREALVNQLDSFADRPIIPLFHDTYQGLGKKKKKSLNQNQQMLERSTLSELWVPKMWITYCWCLWVNSVYITNKLKFLFLCIQGISLSNGYLWKKQRKFTNIHLRYFGEGQRSMEKSIQVECNCLCEAFKEEQGK